MSEVRDYIRRVIERTSLVREKFADNALPTGFSKIRLIPFFGDIRSEFVFSTLLLHRLFPGEYVIVCSWPGHSGLYPNISEYWAVDNEAALAELVRHTNRFTNDKVSQYERLLLRYFDNVTTADSFISDYYHDGFQDGYLNKFDDICYKLPALPSVNLGWQDASVVDRRKRILLMPSKFIGRWYQGQHHNMFTDKTYWVQLITELLKRKYFPIIVQDYSTYDVSPDFAADCAYILETNILAVLGVMRACDCVLDTFTGLSRLALAARAPYLVCDERQRYFSTKDYTLDDLCGGDIPHTQVFSFAPLTATSSLNQIITAVTNRLDEFIAKVDRSRLPSTIEQEKTLSYDMVRKREVKRIGMRLVAPVKHDV